MIRGMISARELEQMPLDSKEHVRLAWVFIGRPVLRQSLESELGVIAAARHRPRDRHAGLCWLADSG